MNHWIGPMSVSDEAAKLGVWAFIAFVVVSLVVGIITEKDKENDDES